MCGERTGAVVLWLPSHHPSGCCTLVVVEERPPPTHTHTYTYTYICCVPIRRLHPPKCVFVGRLRHGEAMKAVPIQRPRPTKTSFVGRLRHGGAAKTVPIHDASSEGCIPRPIASPRRDECSRNSKATSNAPSVSQENEGYIRWTLRSLPYPRIHRAPVKTGLLFKQNSDGSVAADECTYKCKYCILIYSNN